MTINLRRIVELFEYFKDRTAWYWKVILGGILGVMLSSGVMAAWAASAGPAPLPAAELVTETAATQAPPTPTWTRVPTETPRPTRTPAPTATPETVYVVWSAYAEKVNLREEPAGRILKGIANGSVVHPQGGVREEGGYTWIEVSHRRQLGWMADVLVWEMVGGYEVLEEGADYYQAPGGTVLGTLPGGTPYRVLAEEEGWREIALPDGRRVWVEG
jgi:hypothetical protein